MTKRPMPFFFACVLVLGVLADSIAWSHEGPPRFMVADASAGDRSVHRMDDGWTLKTENGVSAIQLGDSWEQDGRTLFDGVGVYHNAIRPSQLATNHASDRGRWLLQIDAAATHAIVRINGRERGRHLGGWTPFRIDVTDLFRGAAKDQDHKIEIEVDERVGHNTQGFLPIVVPHFGGIWKHVRLIHTSGDAYLDDLTLLVSGFRGFDVLDFEAAVRGVESLADSNLKIGVRTSGPSDDAIGDWTYLPVQKTAAENRPSSAGTDSQIGRASGRITPPIIRRWTQKDPFRYETEIVLMNADGLVIDRLTPHAAIRHFETRGRTLLVNGQPVNIRGVLNWGYSPPRLCPTLDEETMRREIQFAIDRGFNLIKFCLWTPPKRYLDLADEMGMLTWVEYPTWHPDFSGDHLAELRREFAELFHYDRNAASVLLRSLTCETGHGAAVDVIRDLYELGHDIVPGAIIEDDSSWIGWHRIHDFYDDHPYGNNPTWPAKLDELDKHIANRRAMPLVLGEAIAADTWERPTGTGPPHDSLSAPAFRGYTADLIKQHGLASDDSIEADSYRYALAMRKYQMEAFRWQLPDAGYVVSVLRDFPKAAMGLIDRRGNSKWTKEDFDWHRDIVLVLNQGRPSRAVAAGQTHELSIDIAGEGPLPAPLELQVLLDGEPTAASRVSKADERTDRASFLIEISVPEAVAPTPITITANLKSGTKSLAVNAWKIWATPTIDDDSESLGDRSSERTDADQPPLLFASELSEELLTQVQKGAHCVLLPSGKSGSPVIRDHWFLRGGPVVANHPLVNRIGRDFLVDLQTMDLAGPVVFEFPLLDQGTPILSLWDNHDLERYRTHALLWETKIGRGKLLVSSLPIGDNKNVAADFVRRELLRHVAGDFVPKAMDEGSLQRLRRELRGRRESLVNADWRFRRANKSESEQLDSDPDATDPSWASTPVQPSDWEPIQITRHWDEQGHRDLDGWGLYRTRVNVPKGWSTDRLFLNFTGVDDHYRVYVNGRWIGSDGVIESRQTAFANRKSHPIPADAIQDGSLEIAVAVFDWYGAGGIFRPVSLSTEPLLSGPAWLAE
ncbi:MAG: sugar-binding domain-containing protein [Planctomycetota bacterium]